MNCAPAPTAATAALEQQCTVPGPVRCIGGLCRCQRRACRFTSRAGACADRLASRLHAGGARPPYTGPIDPDLDEQIEIITGQPSGDAGSFLGESPSRDLGFEMDSPEDAHEAARKLVTLARVEVVSVTTTVATTREYRKEDTDFLTLK